jgi:hypothetical protein
VPTKETAPRLRGWVTLQELAQALGVSRQAVHQMTEDERLETLHRTGADRPVWLVTEDEQARLLREQEQARLAREARSTDHDNNSSTGQAPDGE